MHEALVSTSRTLRSTAAASAGAVLVGNPNVGKSALFGALTGTYVTVSNYPGTTVEIATGHAATPEGRIPLVDTPGVHSFLPSSEDERVTREMLLSGEYRTAVAVADAKNLDRALLLSLQLIEMGTPHVLCLNMMDEAMARGMSIDRARLSEILGVEVVPTVAIRRTGVPRLREALGRAEPGRARVTYPDAVERAVARIVPLIPETPVSRRALALMALAGDAEILGWLRERAGAAPAEQVEVVGAELARSVREDVGYVLTRARMRLASEIAGQVCARGDGPSRKKRVFAPWLEALTTHPIGGFPVLAAVLYLAYLFVGVLGAGTLVDLLENGLFGNWINPAVISLSQRWIPWSFLRDLLVGPYGIFTMALTYSLALVLPIVGTFFIAFGLLEDSGYLPRLAVMVNGVFRRIGLNGKAVLPMVLGLGCDTMATLTTRILETRKERLIVIILLALGVPCSAQLTVILAMLGSLSAAAVGIWLAVVVGVILLVGALASRLIPGRSSDFIVELPPLRLPSVSNILSKTLARIEWYLKEAVPLFILGTLILFLADRLRLLAFLERLTAPVVSGLLGLPAQTSEAFVIGFLRRDFGAAGLYHMAQDGQLDPVQIVVAVVTITLFIPCVANFFMMVKERGWRTGLAIAAFIFPFAVLVGTGLNWLLRALPVSLR